MKSSSQNIQKKGLNTEWSKNRQKDLDENSFWKDRSMRNVEYFCMRCACVCVTVNPDHDTSAFCDKEVIKDTKKNLLTIRSCLERKRVLPKFLGLPPLEFKAELVSKPFPSRLTSHRLELEKAENTFWIFLLYTHEAGICWSHTASLWVESHLFSALTQVAHKLKCRPLRLVQTQVLSYLTSVAFERQVLETAK